MNSPTCRLTSNYPLQCSAPIATKHPLQCCNAVVRTMLRAQAGTESILPQGVGSDSSSPKGLGSAADNQLELIDGFWTRRRQHFWRPIGDGHVIFNANSNPPELFWELGSIRHIESRLHSEHLFSPTRARDYVITEDAWLVEPNMNTHKTMHFVSGA